MPFSSFDLISPKITLYYKGHNSHVSRLGGFLSICLIIIICTIIVYCILGLIEKILFFFCIWREYKSWEYLSNYRLFRNKSLY